MRLSNLIARAENGLVSFARSTKSTARNLKATLRTHRDTFKVAVLAQQVADTDRRLGTLSAIDRREVELRAIDIQALQEATAIRKQERLLRAHYASLITSGTLPLDVLMQAHNDFTQTRPSLAGIDNPPVE